MGKGDATRQRIIEAAAPLFNQRGFAGCSMQDVMEVTGLGKGGLYRHFKTKEELAADAFRYALATSVKTRTEDLDRIEGALGKLRYVVERFVETPSGVAGGCPLMNTAVDADDGNAVLRGLARKGVADWKRRLCGLIHEGRRRGEIRGDVEVGRVANMIVATLEGALMISQLEGTKTALRDARAVLEEMLAGIAVQR